MGGTGGAGTNLGNKTSRAVLGADSRLRAQERALVVAASAARIVLSLGTGSASSDGKQTFVVCLKTPFEMGPGYTPF